MTSSNEVQSSYLRDHYRFATQFIILKLFILYDCFFVQNKMHIKIKWFKMVFIWYYDRQSKSFEPEQCWNLKVTRIFRFATVHFCHSNWIMQCHWFRLRKWDRESLLKQVVIFKKLGQLELMAQALNQTAISELSVSTVQISVTQYHWVIGIPKLRLLCK